MVLGEYIKLERKQRAETQQKKEIAEEAAFRFWELWRKYSMPIESDSEEAEADEEPLVLKKDTHVVKYTSKKSSSMFVDQITALDSEEDLVSVTFLKRTMCRL